MALFSEMMDEADELRARIERLTAENERLRAAAQVGLSWMGDLEHMGSIVDQERLSSDLTKVTEAIGWVRVDQQRTSND